MEVVNSLIKRHNKKIKEKERLYRNIKRLPKKTQIRFVLLSLMKMMEK